MELKTIREIDFEKLTREKSFHPSPHAWEDQVLYFIMVDRFSDNKENHFKSLSGNMVLSGTTPPYEVQKHSVPPEQIHEWFQKGDGWCGGNLKGVISKIGYLKRLGVTGIWISPIFKQVEFYPSYHGYGIQNFLEIDPHFGTKEDLVELTRTAHENGIYVILDVILNHTGDVFAYDTEKIRDARVDVDTPLWNGKDFPVKGFRDQRGHASIPFVKNSDPEKYSLHDSIWPLEFQDPGNFTKKGRISNWDYNPEFLEGDFYGLKDLKLGDGDIDNYKPSKALIHLVAVYKYWIGFADLDGLRIDTVKHMDKGAARYFAACIHEFTMKIGKENFYLLGEITGGRSHAFQTLEETGINAALGIDDIQDKMEATVKGNTNPSEYFNLFTNSLLIGKDSQKWFRNKIVIMSDDHDKVVENGYKTRFCAQGSINRKFLLNMLSFNLTTMGIPCIYYGTEQGFDGEGDDVRYIRECMFGGEFGAFRSKHGHFFNENTYEYIEMAKIIRIVRQHIAIRRGRQYLREISGDGKNFGVPRHFGGNRISSVIAWSRVLDDEEIVLAISTEPEKTIENWITVDRDINEEGKEFEVLYPEDSNLATKVTKVEDGRLCIHLSVPPHRFLMLKQKA